MDKEKAAEEIRNLQEKQRDLLMAIALADEAQAERRRALAEVRAQLTGVTLGLAFVAPKASEASDD